MIPIKEKLGQISTRPGVYLLKDPHGNILYVGKAKNLRSRLRSHFNPGRGEEIRHSRLMAQVDDLETIVVDSEVEALILEANFIKEHKPKYNVNLKDDKSYPYIRVTKEMFPKVFITRKLPRDGSCYFGPFTDVKTLRQLMSAIRRIFPLRTCGLLITEESIRLKKHKVCLNYHIGRCKGPCEGLIPPEEYAWLVDQVVDFIKGRNQEVVGRLKERMAVLSGKQAYEDAAFIRDELRILSQFISKQKVVDAQPVDRDILAVAVAGNSGCALVFDVREGKMTNRRHFYLTQVEQVPESEILSLFLRQYYLKADFIPDELVLPFPPEDLDRIAEWLSGRENKQVQITIPQKGEKKKLIDMCLRNAELLLEELLQQKAEASRIAPSVLALQNDLKLAVPPVRIEAFDISNTAGSDPVASMIVFENGKPKKSEYRKFKIRTVEGIDDFAMMAEVLERRISRIQRENKSLPDLILVDGGKGQLSASCEVLRRLGVETQPIIGLAKRLEEIFRPGLSDPQTLPKSSPSLRLLQRIRDEAHRFAITFHRSLRRKRASGSELDSIPGIGPSRRNALLKAFGSLEGVRKADAREIAAVPGMNRSIAERLRGALDRNQI